MKRVAFIILITLLLPSVILALPAEFNDGLQFGKQHQNNAFDALKGFKPNQVFKNFDSHPKQEKYFHGFKKKDTGWGNDAQKAKRTNEATKNVEKNFEDREPALINLNSDSIKRAQFIVSDADNIAKGVSDKYVDCHQTKHCRTEYTTHVCQMPVQKSLICHQRLIVTVEKSKKHPKSPIIKENWRNQCSRVKLKQCHLTQALKCIDGDGTRNINGIKVHRACWLKEAQYTCGATSFKNTCQSFASNGCEIKDKLCLKKDINGKCLLNQITYSCPKKNCDVSSEVICGSNTLCLSGNCPHAKSKPNPDFGKGASAFNAIGDASKQYSKKRQMFTGQALRCRDKAFGFSNCCNDSGWGKDLGLAHCNNEEKKLGHAKQKGLVFYLGRYCSKEIKFIVGKKCVEHKKTYCVFPNKLSSIIQKQGRYTQLQIDFGGQKNPNCRGLTPKELQHINFGKINFGAYTKEIQKKLKNHSQSDIEQHIGHHLHPLNSGGQY